MKKIVTQTCKAVEKGQFRDMSKEDQHFLFLLDLDPEILELLIIAKEQGKDLKPVMKKALGLEGEGHDQ